MAVNRLQISAVQEMRLEDEEDEPVPELAEAQGA